MSKADAHLYGIKPAPKKASNKDISSSTTLAFTSQLSSLLASSSTSSSTTDSTTSRGRPRPSSNKPSIFTSHNRNTKKRALKDLENDDEAGLSRKQRHATSDTLDPTDPATLHRSKRKMEEKARLYAAMKRGDYIPSSKEGADPLVDFDRKWAEKNQARGGGGVEDFDTSSGSDNDTDEEDTTTLQQTIVEWEDEYGRLRRGTAAEKAHHERKISRRLLGAEELDRLSARPSAPGNLIRGDTIQTSAFAPDASTEEAMASLASKRDKSATPPPATHYAAASEIRNRGTGFYTFSSDEKVREEEMRGLESERRETERVRSERGEMKRRRREEVERRRGEIAKRRAGREADAFLDGLPGAGGLQSASPSAEIGEGLREEEDGNRKDEVGS